jgi:energy-coupling factor transport system ATP-binding protein
VADPLARMRGFGYRYPEAVAESLRDVDLEIEPGELIVLAGRSGSGKTTLLRACCGLVPHYHGGEVRGELQVAGLDVRDHGPAELGGMVGLVAQDPETQVVSTTVRAELELPLEMRGESPAARSRAVEEVALALAMPHLLDRPVDTLSGGELQRVALGAALVGRPRLVLLDEPTSQLDPVAGDELIGLLRRLNEEWGTAILIAEHRLERCLAAADRAIAMAGGRIAFDGPPRDFLRWALEQDPVLATPGARLFDLAGLGPPPVGVKEARRALRERGIEAPDDAVQGPARNGSGAPPSGRSAALEVRDAWVELDDGTGSRDVLRGVELSIARGERVALMGRNGAGKTTLLRAVAGRIDPVRGRASAPGGCALCPQSPGDLLVRERVGDELPGDIGERALAAAGLDWAADADPRDLSGGERQRLALAIVMAGRGVDADTPGLICMDEPTRGLDRARKAELAAWAESLTGRGAAVVIATHDVEFAASFADRVVLLGDGEVIADGPAAEVLSGGWYFATEVARILGAGGAILPERGAELLRERLVAAPGAAGTEAP